IARARRARSHRPAAGPAGSPRHGLPRPRTSPGSRGAMVSRRGSHDIVVVGAGMVGAVLALRLARAGFDVALIEAQAPAPWRPEDDVDLRVVALAPSSIEQLQEVGVWNSIGAARSCAYRRMHVWDALAPGALTFDSAEDGEAALGHIVENRLIQHALWQAAQIETRITTLCPARVAATRDDGDGRTVDLAGGERLAAPLVVAADGGDSPLRELLGIATRGGDYAQRAIVAHVSTERPHEATAWQRFLPQATIAFLPLA